jgi:hypothetical protein
MSVLSSELGPRTPSPASECVSPPPLDPKEGINTFLRDMGWGEGTQSGRLDRKPCTLYTL